MSKHISVCGVFVSISVVISLKSLQTGGNIQKGKRMAVRTDTAIDIVIHLHADVDT